jgi:hypothetical protein
MNALTGVEFFYSVMALGIAFAGFTGTIALLRKRNELRVVWDNAERAGLSLSLELGVFAVVFALLPFPLFYWGRTENFAWRLSSMALALFFGFQMLKTITRARQYEVRWPTLMNGLVVLTGLVIAAEFVNAVWWSSLAVYTAGLLWVLTLCGIQFIAIVSYDRQNQYSSALQNRDPYADRRGEPIRNRMRGVRSGGDTDRTAYVHGYRDSDADAYPRLGRDPNRYADKRATQSDRRAVTDTPVWRGASTNGRRPDGDADSRG